MNGIQAFLEILARYDLPNLFGNPGTTELPLNDALATDDRFRYYFGIHEIPVMAMAHGFASASGRVGVVNLHTACGLGNAMGMLFNAFTAGTPLLVTAGQQDARLRFGEPVLAGELVDVVKPWTKWAHEIQRVEDLPDAMRRAIQTALTPPTGPVFLSFPLDVQLADASHLDLSPTAMLDRHVRPALKPLQQAASILRQAKNPVILAGSRVTESDGCDALAKLAETLGCPVFAECPTAHGRWPMSPSHPLYFGPLPIWSPDVRERLKPFDVAFVVGMNLLTLYIHHEPARAIPEHLRLIHLDCNPWEIGKNFPVEVGIVGDPREGLIELQSMIESSIDENNRRERALEKQLLNNIHEGEIFKLKQKAIEQQDRRPMSPLRMMTDLAEVLPSDTIIVDEAPTTHQQVLERLGVINDPTSYFAHRGWALGWGIGCAIGVKIAKPDRPVLALIGDGSAMYGIQALWSAAHHRIPIVVVICNNANYQILKNCGRVMNLSHIADGNAPGMAIQNPAIDFVKLAESLGVEAERISEPGDWQHRVVAALRGDRPRLFDVSVDIA